MFGKSVQLLIPKIEIVIYLTLIWLVLTKGDSGGPLIHTNGKQVGITSWHRGERCAALGYPSGTCLCNYLDHIFNQVTLT